MWFFKQKRIDPENIIEIINKKFRIKRYVQLIIGIFIMSLAFNIFFLPNDIVFGGIAGLSILINKIFQTEPIKFIAIGSAVSLVLGFIALDKKRVMESFFASILYPALIYATSFIKLELDLSNLLLAALLGGVIYGFGLGLVMRGGLATGGTDILKQIINKYFKISINNAMLIIDGIIIFISAFFFGLTSVMYAITALYIISVVVDRIVLGISDSKVFYIITENSEDVTSYILEVLKYGVTTLEGRGGYTNDQQKVLFTVIPTSKYFLLKEGIKKIDEKAFFLVTDAYQVVGGQHEE